MEVCELPRFISFLDTGSVLKARDSLLLGTLQMHKFPSCTTICPNLKHPNRITLLCLLPKTVSVI